DDLFEQADIAIGSLARHRSGITTIKTLKNREYAARGIPFIYSEKYQMLEPTAFLDFAKAAGMVGLKGHRLVGGFRASIYNAMPIESVQALVDCMQAFEKSLSK
ncbi:MAG: hypothetical protein RSA50_07120, partial [Mucinivorans sp.]